MWQIQVGTASMAVLLVTTPGHHLPRDIGDKETRMLVRLTGKQVLNCADILFSEFRFYHRPVFCSDEGQSANAQRNLMNAYGSSLAPKRISTYV
ncbi:hypothetical protein PoB_006111100 [Plakobranchus ocellatus]|uniref:Uncharacterized protein n=1 Tax=Plakobranchus ocellatus TaxID=259542 RepID=A0AAV4CS32_9GAST|nr:hypothetical protein PoB_006111100 [Plakobranchus ocellatus]